MSLPSTLHAPIRSLPKPLGRMEALKRKKAMAQPSLRLSDWWFLFGLLIAIVYVANPFPVNLERVGITKHLPLLICFSGAMLTNIGHWVFSPMKKPAAGYWQVLRVGLPFILLGFWIVAGSAYARKIEGINSTFVIVGLYMLFGFMTARVILLSPARSRLIRYFLIASSVAAFFMIARMMASAVGVGDVTYHELEAFVVPLAVYYALRPMGNQHWQALLTLGYLFGGLVFRKNTGFLVLGMTLLYLWIAEWRFRFRENSVFRFWTALWLVVIVAGGIAVASYIVSQRGNVMPTGNPEYRMRTYEKAWERFMTSPVWGTSFAASATEKFEGYQILVARGMLATHSDLLDLAANGGVMALALWLWGYIRVIRYSIRTSLRGRQRDDMRAAAHAFACMSITSIVVYAFNPILLQPAKALLLWTQLGMLVGIGLHISNTEKLAEAAEAKATPKKPGLTKKSTALSKAKP